MRVREQVNEFVDRVGKGIVDPEKEMAAIYRKQLANFKDHREPMIDDLEESLGDRDITDRGKVEAGRLGERSQGMANRLNSGRSSSLLPSQRAAQVDSIDKVTTLGSGSINTMASRTERANRVATRQQLLSISEQLSDTGTASMAQVAQSKADRDARNEAAKGSRGSQIMGIVGTVAGGMIGGPVGAAAVGSIGGMIGGRI